MTTRVLGLTGSIGTGKSTCANMFRRLGVPIHDSDAYVKQLLTSYTDVIDRIAKIFPDVMEEGRINRAKLAGRVFRNTNDLKALEYILHPLVRESHHEFIEQHQSLNTPIIVLDIPLLFEKGYETLCHKVMVTVCQWHIQRRRVLARPHMTPEIFERILAQQMPSAQKIGRADYVLDTSKTRRLVLDKVEEIIRIEAVL